MQGLLLLDKPQGKTSFGAVAAIRHLCGEKRVGHTGTLDPLATGVLPVFIGRATALSSYLLAADKSYTARVKLGVTTDTLDITGRVLSERDAKVDAAEISAVLNEFKGKQMQVPPAFSALKKDGVRAYALAREGKEVILPPREIDVKNIELISELENNEFTFSCTVSKGTYIRALARDIGERLGCGAVLTELTRTQTAGFKLSECVKLSELTKDNIRDYIMPADKAIEHIKSVNVTENQAKRFLNGGQLNLDRLKTDNYSDNELYRVYFEENFLGLGFVDLKKGQLAIKCVIGEK